MKRNALNKILELHRLWLENDPTGKQADFHEADLRYVDLSNADLKNANLSDADLSGANLSNADLSGADLSNSNLFNTDLSYADLSNANICGSYASSADFRCADLRGANLSGTELTGANLYDTHLSENEKIRKGMKLSEPMIGWKKCDNDVLVKFEIPKGAIVFSIHNRRCRTDRAKVLEIIGADTATSTRWENFECHVGDVIEIFDFNCEYNEYSASGVQFFRTKEEALKS